MPLDPFWQQAFAAAPAAPCEGRASAFAFHASAKTVLTFARAFGWLISAFHIYRKPSAAG
jgi:hypothetical protein